MQSGYSILLDSFFKDRKIMLANLRTAAYTAAFITFGCAHQTALAQIYDVANIQTIDLNKTAGYTRSRDGTE